VSKRRDLPAEEGSVRKELVWKQSGRVAGRPEGLMVRRMRS